MAHLIDKDALVAEIERLFDKHSSKHDIDEAGVVLLQLRENVENFEVKEVDLEKEIENLIEKEKAFVTGNREVKYYNGDSFNHIYELEFIAKHFFELGLKAQKGE